MTTYNTGNAVGSADPRDLYDNAQALDEAINSQATTFSDRFGSTRRTWAAAVFYVDLGAYGAGLEITGYNEIFLYSGEYYKLSTAVSVPYTTTGTWGGESSNFVAIGDAALRSDLANPSANNGISLVAGGMRHVESMSAFVGGSGDDQAICVDSFYGGWAATVAGPRGRSYWHHDGTTGGAPTTSSTAAIIAAMATGKVIRADGKGWRLSCGRVVTPQMFGAVGDMTDLDDGTDNSPMIQAANDYLESGGEGGTLYFEPIGTSYSYGLGSSLERTQGNVKWIGDSPTATRLKLHSGVNDDVVKCLHTSPGEDNMFFEGLMLHGNNDNNTAGHCVNMSWAHASTHFKNCILYKPAEDCLHIRNSTVILLENTALDACGGWSVDADDCLSIFIKDCAMQFFGAGALNIANTSGVYESVFSVDGLHIELSSTNASSGCAIQLSGGSGTANQSINVGLKDVGFRATSAAGTDCIKVVDDNVNVVAINCSKTGFGAAVDHFDSTKSVSGVDTLNLWTYSGGVSKSIIEKLTTFGELLVNQSAGDWLKIRRSDFGGLRIGTDDDNDWEFQDTGAKMLIRRRVSAAINNAVQFDADATAGNTRMFVYDVDNGQLERVSVGSADSGGTGYKVLRIPN